MPLAHSGGCCGFGSTACVAWRICGGIAVFILCHAGLWGGGRGGGRDWSRSARARCHVGRLPPAPACVWLLALSWGRAAGGRAASLLAVPVPPIGTCPFVLGAMGVHPPFALAKALPWAPGVPRCPPACVYTSCIYSAFATCEVAKVAIGLRILMHVFWEGWRLTL